ncbi:unnamed protein product, partial [Didymodactylos carnosus]
LASSERPPFTIQQNSLKCTSTTSQVVHGHLTLGKTLTKTTAPPSSLMSAILKLDIEGFEAYALQNANILFDKTEIHAIYMEFGKLIELKSSDEMMEAIKYMIHFLKIRNYEPYE